MTATVNDNFRVFALIDSHLNKDGRGYVNIRIANRKNRNKNIDIAVYLESGERFKLKPGQMKDGRFDNGEHESKRNEINHYLNGLKHKLDGYTANRKVVTKTELENFLYGVEFLQKHKKARTKEIEVKVKESVPTEFFQALRQEFPKRREFETVRTVDEDGFEVIEQKQVVIDPLSLEEFPKRFSPELYEKFKNETIAELRPEHREAYLLPSKKFFLDQLIKFKIEASKLFHRHEVKEIIKVGNAEIKQYEEQHGKLEISEKGNLPHGANAKLIEIKEEVQRKTLSTEQIYKRGLYNKKDIFEIYALTYYDDTITNEFYPKIVVRLFEYKERVNPPSNPKAYNKEWILNFFRWFETNGFYVISTKSFDPLKYDPKMFNLDKERKQYEGKSLQKMLNIIKDLSRKFYKRGLLPEVKDLSEIRIQDFTKKKDRKGTRKEYALTKDQFDTLFHHQISNKDLGRYQEIFDEVNKSKTIEIDVNDLITAKQMFICQVMFGGLRGWHDYKTASLQTHSKGVQKIAFHVGKKDDAIENPLNAYTLAILQETNGTKPFIDNEERYRSLIKTVVRFINFDKSIKKNKYKNEYQPLSELFQPGFFARKTFAQILRAVGVEPLMIQLFTGHEREKDELQISYLDDNTIENKAKLLLNLKIGNGE